MFNTIKKNNALALQIDLDSTIISMLDKQHTLNTISDVILEVRIRMSKQFLLQSDYSVAEIAEKTGFIE